jgi:hypothetical protein
MNIICKTQDARHRKNTRRKTQDTRREEDTASLESRVLGFAESWVLSLESWVLCLGSRVLHLFSFAVALVFMIISSPSWAVYGVPIINLKHAEQLERAGRFAEAAADRELAADFYKFVSIPQFQDDMEYFQKIGDEDKARFCRNTISGFQKSMRLCLRKAEEDRIKGKLTKEQIDKYRKRNRMRMLAGAEVYPIMHNGQMGIDVNALEKNGELPEDFEKAAEGRERTARLYEKITIPWVLHEAEALEKDGKTGLAAEYSEKAKRNYQKAAENRRKAEALRGFEKAEYAMKALEDDDPSIRKLALKKLIRNIDYLGLLKAARSAYLDVSQMAKEALESNKKLVEAIKADALVLALGSGDVDIRRTAIEELERLAGTTLGYSPDADQSDRDTALARWQDYIGAKLKNGLSGIYYKGKNFDREILARVDKQIDFEWKSKPHESLPKDKFSIRWIGKIKIPKTGKYTLSVKADDGARIWIGKIPDLKQVISDWSEYSYAAYKNEVYLEEGLHDVKIEYYEKSGNAAMKLFWDSEGTKKQIIPEENLFHVSLGKMAR